MVDSSATQLTLTEPSLTVGFIGLGVMGAPMCANIVARSNHQVVVHDRRPEPVAELVAAGAADGGSVAGVVERCDIVLLSLPGGEALEEVVADEDGIVDHLRPGMVVADHTTAPVELTRQLAALCQERGAQYCDAPIARTRQAARDGTLSIMVGGEAGAIEQLRPIFRLMATDITHCGDVGAGQIAKILNNMILFQNVRAVAEAHAIATGLRDQVGVEVDVDTVFEVIGGASGGSFALDNHGRKAMFVGQYPTEAFSIRYALKDLGYALDLAVEAGVVAEGAETTRRLLEAARDAGYGEEYFPVIRRLL